MLDPDRVLEDDSEVDVENEVNDDVQVLEDDPAFDAGRGSVLNHSGQVEMDAMIMDGANLDTGAVAGVSNVRNPVELAR